MEEPGREADVRPAVAQPEATGSPGDPYTGMTTRFGRLARAFAERFFANFRFDPSDVERLLELEQRGAVVYVMRYSSRLDYFLFNWLFLASGVRLSVFANGIRFFYYRPIGEALKLVVRRIGEMLFRGLLIRRRRASGRAREVTRSGQSMFLFLRTDKIRSRLLTRRGAVRTGYSELDQLREVVDACFEESTPVFLVPLVLFWRRGARPQRRLLNVLYGAARPTDTWKVLSFLWNYRGMAVRVGTPIDLAEFVEGRRDDGPSRVVRSVRRVLLIFLRREERPVEGTPLPTLLRTEEIVLRDPDLREVIAETAAATRPSAARIEARARRIFRRIAAHPSPLVLAILDLVVTRIFSRLFERVEIHGLDRVVQAAKLNPLVLVPSHRSHFDYLLLSWVFYERHLVPPLVAAGENLSFWPLGPIFRRGGAYFLRRSFEGDRLYSTVFRSYVQQLLKDGVTQEFFIEGTRSRTGKTQPPRLGMLGMILQAYARGVRRDAYIVPVNFTYERLVEERSMTDERRGVGKARESLLGLIRARKLLSRRSGTAVLCFGEPISLAETIGEDRELFVSRDPSDALARRRVTERLGIEICRRINGLAAAGRTQAVAAVLLAAPGHGIRREDLVPPVRELCQLLAVFGIEPAEALTEDLDRDLAGTLTLLEGPGLIHRTRDREGEIVHFEEADRDVLDYYRQGLTPVLALPATLALALSREEKEVRDRASEWLDLLRIEYFAPEGAERSALFETSLDYFRERGWVEERDGGQLFPSRDGRRWLDLLTAQVRPSLRAYQATFEAVETTDGSASRDEILARAHEVVERSLLLGETRFPEASNRSTFSNAVDFLVQEGMLAVDEEVRRSGSRVRPGTRWGELAALRDRVAEALRTR